MRMLIALIAEISSESHSVLSIHFPTLHLRKYPTPYMISLIVQKGKLGISLRNFPMATQLMNCRLVVQACVPNLKVLDHFKIACCRASLVAQWLRICLPMQGTRVRALVWEDPTCRGAAGSVSHDY